MIVLKPYQQRVLDSLREYFRQCSRDNRPDEAFRAVQIQNGWTRPAPYMPVQVPGLDQQMPYVCLRVPTGGGKTLLACHAAGLAMTDLLHAERAVVLWLVPSNTILDQTADALRNPRHPYRRALELACGAVEVMTIEEALHLSRATVDGQTTVIVSTIQSFRVEDTTGRKVYAQNSSFAEHLLNLSPALAEGLHPGPDGKPLPSLVNMLRLRRPIVIVDEAHNARTDLSFDTLGKVSPSCIIEFTATPDTGKNRSNVLHYASAAELKAADMIKLPVRVFTRHPGQRDELLAEAVSLRSNLEKIAGSEAQETGEYLRPILLIQAEKVDDCEPLRDRLVADFGIDKDAVKISVGKLDELEGIKEISSPKSPVRVILTVQKLREGWDCPFAYVLCSLRETRSPTAIEQIVGRVLRLPNAQAKRHPELNCAYIFSVSPSIGEVLAELREALVANGFTNAEAEQSIRFGGPTGPSLWSQPETVRLASDEIDAVAFQKQTVQFADKVKIDSKKGEITLLVPLDNAATEVLAACVKTPEAKAKIREASIRIREREKAFGGSGETRTPSPYERGLDFVVPRLCVLENGNLFEFEDTDLLEHPWKLGEKDASLRKEYDPNKRPEAQAGQVDIGDKGEMRVQVTPGAGFIASLQQQALALGGAIDWTRESLITWLDRHIIHQDIPAGESAVFLHKVLRGLMASRGIENVATLALDRFRLRDEIEERIRQHRDGEKNAAFQTFLLPGSKLAVDNRSAINFKSMSYEPGSLYSGAFQFQKHYFGAKPGELTDGTEEFQCAQYLDGLPEIAFWIRNLVRKTSSFSLQTSKDRFYPDFICKLNTGRILVVEYKGGHLYDAPDAKEKRDVGSVWAARSQGRCLFVMPTEGNFGVIRDKIG